MRCAPSAWPRTPASSPTARPRVRARPCRRVPRSSATSSARRRPTCSTGPPVRVSPAHRALAEGDRMLELGRAGSLGYPKGEAPILRDGTVVAVLRASNWKEAATAVIGEGVWVFAKRRGRLLGRWAAEPEDAAGLTAGQTSVWK